MIRFFEVSDPQEDQPFAVIAETDLSHPGSSKVYRWIPNLQRWVRSDPALRDRLSFPMDRLNDYREIDAGRAAELVRTLSDIRAGWVVDEYQAQPESIDVDLAQLLGR